jgi:multiple sugar transport system permease protein
MSHSAPTGLAASERQLARRMLMPAFTVVAALVIFPVAWNIWLSLKPVLLADLRSNSLLEANLTLANFQKVLGEPGFGELLLTTLAYTVGGSALSIVLGLTAALLMGERFPGRAVVRGLLISPYIAPVVAVAFTWSFILDPQLGVVNWLALDSGLIDAPIPFFSGRWLDVDFWGLRMKLPLALSAVVAFEGWRYFPFALLFILARLQAIPQELYQAAAVDGAGPIRRFIHVTLPELRHVLATLFLFRFIWTINKFDDIFLLTRGQAGTKVMTVRIYDYAFGEFDVGAGSALAMVLFGLLAAFLWMYLRWALSEREAA